MLAVEGLRTPYLGPLDLTVAPGELVSVSGASGSGKSLLLRAIADLDPHEGSIVLEGEEQRDVPPPDWRRRVGLLPAAPAWWGEHVADSFPGGIDPAAEAGDLIDALCLPAASVGGWEIERLSTGESQRLALLRILTLTPRLLLLDEPTANLDEANTERLEDCVKRFLAERSAAALWVSHDSAQQKRLGGRMIRLSEGRLAP